RRWRGAVDDPIADESDRRDAAACPAPGDGIAADANSRLPGEGIVRAPAVRHRKPVGNPRHGRAENLIRGNRRDGSLLIESVNVARRSRELLPKPISVYIVFGRRICEINRRGGRISLSAKYEKKDCGPYISHARYHVKQFV